MLVKKSGLAWISVRDLKRAQDFFTDVLGLSVTSFNKEFGWAELCTPEGGMRLGIGKGDQQVKPGSNAVVTFTVDDIYAMKKVLEGKKVTIIGDIIEIPGHVKLLTFTDPDGNTFQLVEELSTK